MARPVPEPLIALYRKILDPCLLDVHAQMHARPSPNCQRQVAGQDCPTCQRVRAQIHQHFPVYDDGWVQVEAG